MMTLSRNQKRVKTYVVVDELGQWAGDPFKASRCDAERVGREQLAARDKVKPEHKLLRAWLRVFGSQRATLQLR